MRRTIKLSVAIVGAVVFLAGCTTVDVREGPGPGVRVRDVRAPYATVRLNQVVITDKSLEEWYGKPQEKRGKIAVESHDARRTPTGTLEVWAVLRNRTDFPLQIEGRTQFFDQDQAPAEGPTAWQRVHLPPQGTGVYREFSTKIEEIAYYYVEIREGR
jgi:hypothetical protein